MFSIMFSSCFRIESYKVRGEMVRACFSALSILDYLVSDICTARGISWRVRVQLMFHNDLAHCETWRVAM